MMYPFNLKTSIMKAVWNGKVITESNKAVKVEGTIIFLERL